MKVIPIALAEHYASGGSTLARLWRVERRDGTVFAFTDHDKPLTFDGLTYKPTSSFDASANASGSQMEVDNLEVSGVLDDEGITPEDIEAGLWDGAIIELRQVNWADLTMGAEVLRFGVSGNVQNKGGQYTTELRGLMQQLQNNVGRIVTPTCDADLGDTRCGVNLGALAVAGVVTDVTNRYGFRDSGISQAAGWFDGGEVIFTSGLNAGLSMEIKAHTTAGSPVDTAIFVLQLPMPFEINIGDTFTVKPGCDKTKATCIAKFSNVLNFRGFSFVPGADQMLQLQ